MGDMACRVCVGIHSQSGLTRSHPCHLCSSQGADVQEGKNESDVHFLAHQ